MSIRPAKFSDIPALMKFIQAEHGRSKYAQAGAVDLEEARQLLLGAVQRMETRGPGGTCVYVAEKDGAIEGFIIGVLERVYQVGDKLEATDLMFVTREDANIWAAGLLLKHFEDWAKSIPKVLQIRVGVTDVIDPHPELVARMYEQRGYERSGIILERKVLRKVEAA